MSRECDETSGTQRSSKARSRGPLTLAEREILREARMTIPIRGTAALVVAAAIIAATAIWLPAYRWFLLISIGLGAAVAGGLYLWHELRPVRDDEAENKRPLGLG
jgi:uncharacterized membrane protein